MFWKFILQLWHCFHGTCLHVYFVVCASLAAILSWYSRVLSLFVVVDACYSPSLFFSHTLMIYLIFSIFSFDTRHEFSLLISLTIADFYSSAWPSMSACYGALACMNGGSACACHGYVWKPSMHLKRLGRGFKTIHGLHVLLLWRWNVLTCCSM